jgi:hypothetical protein
LVAVPPRLAAFELPRDFELLPDFEPLLDFLWGVFELDDLVLVFACAIPDSFQSVV